MAKYYDFIDHENEKTIRNRKILFVLVLFISFSFFLFPEIKAYSDKWELLKEARVIAEKILAMKTKAIKDNAAYEVVFAKPNSIHFYKASNCGISAQKDKIDSMVLGSDKFQILSAKDVQGESEATELHRICYSPLTGSSLPIDGILYGSVYFGEKSAQDGDVFVKITLLGANADIELE